MSRARRTLAQAKSGLRRSVSSLLTLLLLIVDSIFPSTTYAGWRAIVVNLSEYILEPHPAQPMVSVVHNDTSVRESLELLIRCEGWQSQTFAFAREFLARPRPLVPNCPVLEIPIRILSGLDLQRRW